MFLRIPDQKRMTVELQYHLPARTLYHPGFQARRGRRRWRHPRRLPDQSSTLRLWRMESPHLREWDIVSGDCGRL